MVPGDWLAECEIGSLELYGGLNLVGERTLRLFDCCVQLESIVPGSQRDQVANALRLVGRGEDLLQYRAVLRLLQGDDRLPVRQRVVDPGRDRHPPGGRTIRAALSEEARQL